MTAENKLILIACVTAVQLACAWKAANTPAGRARDFAALVGVSLLSLIALAICREVWP